MGPLDLTLIFGVPILLVALFVLPFLRVGVELADEGYLVFGTASLLDGQIPIRDFRAYDPGRYYWCGLFALFFGRGYFATRIAMAVTMMLALGLLTALVLKATGEPLLSVLSCALALIWMQPRTKQIENLFVVLGLLVLFNLSENGTSFDYVVLGGTIGLSAFFGLNIFTYLVGTSVLAFAFALALPTGALLANLGLGLALGFMPVLLIMLTAKGYADEYLHRKILTLLKRGTSNLKLPLPWLWANGTTGFDGMPPVQRWSLMALFTLLPLLFLCGLSLPFFLDFQNLNGPTRLVFLASCFGLSSFHHTLSRADLVHIFQPVLCLIFVLSAGGFALFGVVGSGILLCLAIAGSISLVWTEQFHLPGYREIRDDLKPFECATDRLLLPTGLATQMEKLQQVTQKFTVKGEPILAAPVQIGLCTMFERTHAAFDSFPVYPSNVAARHSMLEDLKRSRPKLMLIETVAVDWRKDLVFLNNYPEVAALIASEYIQLETISGIEVYVRSDAYSS